MYEPCPNCGGTHPTAAEELPEDYRENLDALVEKLIKGIFEGKPDILPLTGLGVQTLSKKVAENYASTLTADFTTPDAEMLTRLTRDVWQFGSAKNFQQLKDLTLLLRDEKGKLREWSSFQKEAAKICGKYNATWFRTEYNTAVGSSIMASRWVQFENEKNDLPFLRYVTVGDSSVRPEHQVLDGVTRPVADAWWNTYYPPNGWGCRCDVVQVPGSIARQTPPDKLPSYPVNPMFRTNLAKTGLIFPKNHPYYVGVPREEIRRTMAWLPAENTFLSVDFGENITLDIHPLHGENELRENIEVSRLLKKFEPEAKIKLLPVFNEQDIEMKKKYYPKKYLERFPSKNPDLLFNGEPADIKSCKNTYSAVQNVVRDGSKQADKIIIMVNGELEEAQIRLAVKGKLNHYPDRKINVIVLFNDKIAYY